MVADQLTYAGRLIVHRCWCGVRHAIPEELHDQFDRGNVKEIHCPLGHIGIMAGKTEGQREREKRREIEVELARERARHDQTRAHAEFEERRARAYKGHLTRVRRRIANGVCPVPGCKRSGFAQVMKHIASQHKDWLAEHEHELADA